MKNTFYALILMFACLGSLFGQETNYGYKEADKMEDWGFIITPYALLASQSTDVGGEKIRQSFKDLASLTNAGFRNFYYHRIDSKDTVNKLTTKVNVLGPFLRASFML